MAFLLQTFNILVDLLSTLIFVRVVLSWMVRDRGPLIHFVIQCTEPILAPIRRLLPIMGGFDLSPVVAVVLLDVLRQIINNSL